MRSVINQDGSSKTVSHNSPQVGFSHEAAGTLSGESKPIGQRDWDKNTPFGKHVGFF